MEVKFLLTAFGVFLAVLVGILLLCGAVFCVRGWLRHLQNKSWVYILNFLFFQKNTTTTTTTSTHY